MRDFLKSNTFYAIISVIIAILIWIYVVYAVRPNHEIWIEDVEITPINVSRLFDDGSLSIIGENEGLTDGAVSADIKIRGKRNVVSSVSKKDISCIIDMITVNREGVYRLKPFVETQVSGIEIVQVKPSSVKLNVENISQRDINIELKTIGTIAEGYEIENIECRTKTVKLTGPESVINRIATAQITLDYSSLSKSDTEKSLKIEYLDDKGESIDSSLFNKSVEYSKVSFNLYTQKEVTVVLTPKYENENKKNTSGHTVNLTADAKDTTENGGVRLKVKLKGTHDAIEKYIDAETVVYTEAINVKNIYADTVLKGIEAAPLSNDVDYVSTPKIDIKATVKSE